jgi:hypothetical protein
MLVLVAAATPLASIDASHIDRINITIDVSGLGPGSHYSQTFHRRDSNTLVSDDGKTTIAQDSLKLLEQALSEAPVAHFAFSRTWITPAVLQQNLALVEQHFLGPARSDAAAEAAYRKAFLDWTELRKRCERSMEQGMYVSDYYPQVTITLYSGAQSVEITTHSQREFLLPLTVSSKGAAQDTWDPALSMALYEVLPKNAPLRDVFGGGDVLPTWAMLATSDRSAASAWRPCSTAVRPFAPY